VTTSSPSQRCVLVTGAARGIGRATVDAFAAEGWRVVAGVRDPDHLDPFGSPAVHVVHLDVTDPDSVRTGVGAAEHAAGGGLTCLVNNAGWALVGAIEDVDLDVARRQFETNLFGAVAVLQAALPGMLRAGGGVVVSVSTLSGRIPLPLFGMYSASKLSLAAVSEALALELSQRGIRVVLVEAGVVATDMARSTVVSGSAQEVDSKYAPIRDSVLGALRGIRQTVPIPADELAGAIVRAAEDPAAPFRLVVPGEGLRPLADVVGGPSDDSHRIIREFLLPASEQGPTGGR
jgi:NAD(P)-dependent dehydrogenase (short-subunit alcohol dehydrogenase family)